MNVAKQVIKDRLRCDEDLHCTMEHFDGTHMYHLFNMIDGKALEKKSVKWPIICSLCSTECVLYDRFFILGHNSGFSCYSCFYNVVKEFLFERFLLVQSLPCIELPELVSHITLICQSVIVKREVISLDNFESYEKDIRLVYSDLQQFPTLLMPVITKESNGSIVYGWEDYTHTGIGIDIEQQEGLFILTVTVYPVPRPYVTHHIGTFNTFLEALRYKDKNHDAIVLEYDDV